MSECFVARPIKRLGVLPPQASQPATRTTTSISSIIPEKLLFYFYTRSKTGRQTFNREINPQTKKDKKFAFIDPRQDGHLNHRPTHSPTLPRGKARKSQTGDAMVVTHRVS